MGNRARTVTFGVLATVGVIAAIVIALLQSNEEKGDRRGQPPRQISLHVTTASRYPEENRLREREPSATAVLDTASWELDTFGADNEIPAEDVSAFSPEAPLEELLVWWRHPEERFRVAALEAIGVHADDPQVWAVLSEALGDPSVDIRRSALTLLAQVSQYWPDSENLIWMSLRDPDPALSQLASVLYGELEQAALETGE